MAQEKKLGLQTSIGSGLDARLASVITIDAVTFSDYPIGISTGPEHVAALSDVLSAFGRAARITIEEMNELEDADSADMLTEISRGVDKWLWFVEAHQQA